MTAIRKQQKHAGVRSGMRRTEGGELVNGLQLLPYKVMKAISMKSVSFSCRVVQNSNM